MGYFNQSTGQWEEGFGPATSPILGNGGLYSFATPQGQQQQSFASSISSPDTSQPPSVTNTPAGFNGILPGDTYPGPGSQPGQYGNGQYQGQVWPELPGTNPWKTPLGSAEYAAQLKYTPNNQIGGMINKDSDPTKYPYATWKKPPATYEEAGGYQQFIDAWRDFYNQLRNGQGLGNWDPSDIDKLKALFDQMGIKYQMKDGKWSGRIYIPDGKGGYIQVDVINGWVNYGHTEQSGALTGQKPSSTGTTGAGGTGGGGVGGLGLPPGFGQPSGNGPWDDRANSLYDQLLKRSQQSLLINRNDPIIRNQADAFAANQTRAMRDYLNGVAEQSGAFANIGAERRHAAEQVGQSTSAFEAQLMGSELSARREEIAQSLQMMGGLLTTEQQLALTRELGYLDASIRMLSIQNQNDQFYANLGFQTSDRSTFYDLVRRGLL